MNSSEIDFIKKEIQKTGFQLEDRVASIFSELKNCEVEQNYYFTDWQTGDFRELDLKITYKVTSPPINIEYIFLVECKHLPGHAWVFVRSRGDQLVFKNVMSTWDNVGKDGRQEPVVEILKPIFKVNGLVCDTYSHRSKEIILDKKKSNKRDDNILSSSIKLAKVLHFEQKKNRKFDEILRESIKREFDKIKIYYPLIVFEGKMFEAAMFPDLDVKPISSAHLNHFSIQNREEIGMIIDIVKVGDLRDFIQERFLMEANQVKEKEAEVRDSYISLIRKLRMSSKHLEVP